MKILRLTIKGFKRVFLSGINEIDYRPDNKTQIILGINGSGKSSLLEQLSPLPANLKKDYKEGGSKYIEIEHYDKLYKLTSGINGKAKHSFVVDDDELNTGGTVSVQARLVEQHFGITNHIQNILLGRNNFTAMSPAERKKWITEISTVDYTFPIALWNKLKHRHRDVVGGIKILESDIVRLQGNVKTKEEIKVIELERDNLSKLIDHCFSLTTHEVSDESDLNAILSKIDKSTKYLTTHRSLLDNDKLSLNKIDLEVVRISTESKLAAVDNQAANKELDKLSVIQASTHDVESLRSKISMLNSKISTIEDTVTVTLDSISETTSYFTEHYAGIITLLTDIGSYSGPDAYQANVISKRDELICSGNLVRKHDTMLGKLNQERSHMESLLADDNLVKCGDCGNAWHNNFDKDVYDKTLVRISEVAIKLDASRLREKQLTTEVNEMDSKIGLIRNLSSYMVTSDAKSFWRKVLTDIDIYNTEEATGAYNAFDNLYRQLTTWNEGHRYKVELSNTNTLLEQSLHAEQLKQDITGASSRNVELRISSNLETIASNVIKLQKLATLRKTYETIQTLQDELRDNVATAYTTKKKVLAGIRNKFINQYIDVVRVEYNRVNEVLRDISVYEGKLNTDLKRVSEYKLVEKVLKLMVKELSPSEGIIAKSINSFLNVFLTDINNLVNRVWGYSMTILPCEVSDTNDLNYIFRVNVADTEIIDDISKTSSSMQEMINLAFRIIFTKYLGIGETPLFLDEFGRTFDKEHRVTAYETVERVLMDKFSQIYIVSHFESMYGRFTNADINIIGPVDAEGVSTDTRNRVMRLT